MRKFESVRIVTFKEDYYTKTKEGKSLLFKAGTKRPMHVGVAKHLEEQGAKIRIEPFDPKPVEERMKAKIIARRKRQTEMAYIQ